ncbi:MAG: ankyrin repeat domain-containing protein [Rickettsiaceae bacterium]|nr:ankyrin repeat domain-containing protein [Rickettsiaceae bacterium]
MARERGNEENQELNQRLLEAIRNNNIKEVDTLLTAGADVNARNTSGETALIYAAWGGILKPRLY